MKFMSILLILSIILCYTGVGMDVSHAGTLANVTNCHKNQHDEISGTETIANSYENDATHHKMFKCCSDALPNATQGLDFGLKEIVVCPSLVNVPTLDVNKLNSFLLSLRIKEHHPPDLFLVNSSLLL